MMKGKMPVLYLRLLGGFEALIEGEPSTLDIWRRHNVRALLTLLMCRRGSELSRGSLFDALWPTSDESHARDSLYALLGALRKALKDTAVPDDFIIRTEDSMSVNHMVVDSDIFELIRLIRSVTSTYTRSPELLLDYARIDELYRGDLVDLDQYDESVGQARRWIRSMFVDAMTHASGLCRENGDPLATIWFARRAFEFGVGREDVFRCLMQAQMYNGQVNAAKETYEECRKYMFKEFGIPLSQETVDVYNELVIPVRRRKHVAGQLRGRGYGSADESRD